MFNIWDFKDAICKIENPPENNYRNINFVRLISLVDNRAVIEIGFWVTYENCKPVYKKTTCSYYMPDLIKIKNEMENLK